jgi:hypothetical protein
MRRKLIYSTEGSIYKENKSGDRLTDGRSPSVGPAVLTDRKGALAIRQPRCRSVTEGHDVSFSKAHIVLGPNASISPAVFYFNSKIILAKL